MANELIHQSVTHTVRCDFQVWHKFTWRCFSRRCDDNKTTTHTRSNHGELIQLGGGAGCIRYPWVSGTELVVSEARTKRQFVGSTRGTEPTRTTESSRLYGWPCQCLIRPASFGRRRRSCERDWPKDWDFAQKGGYRVLQQRWHGKWFTVVNCVVV